MLLAASVLGRVARRTLGAFVLVEGLWVALGVLGIARREPVLGTWALLHQAPILAAYASVPCCLAALAAGAAATIAELSRDGEIAGAAASGIGPRPFLVGPLLLALLVTPWVAVSVDRWLPDARAARDAQVRMLLRTPALAVERLTHAPDLLDGLFVELQPRGGGTFEAFWALELAPEGTPRAVWHAPTGALRMPADRDVLQLELEDARVWRRAGDRGPLSVASASHARLERLVTPLSSRQTSSERETLRTLTLGELSTRLDPALVREPLERRRARAEIAGRLAMIASPVPLVLAGLALGLLVGSRGRATGAITGAAFVAAVYLPAWNLARDAVADGAPAAVVAIPALLPALLAVPVLRGWRPR